MRSPTVELRAAARGRRVLCGAAAIVFAVGLRPGWSAPQPETRPQLDDLTELDTYIRAGWKKLTRSTAELAAATVDSKMGSKMGGPETRQPIYVSRSENLRAIRARLIAGMPADQAHRLDLRRLPSPERPITEHGLLYLPRPYVVPGGRFNEMYGWDSYFILRGLLCDGELQRAQDLVENAIYEVTNFGKVLNANRTYYLTRSQPPLLSQMVRAVFEVTQDRAWLAATLPALRKQYAYWTQAPHLAASTGLSRYHASGEGPAPEVVAGERDAAGRTHYDRVRAALAAEVSPTSAFDRLYDRRRDRLTPLAYVADRTVRESGFDTSDRFGRFSLGILDYAPVCLNSLLYAMERDIAAIIDELGNVGDSTPWLEAAERRARRVRELMWDDARGLFLDYDVARARRSDYAYATTFFPLWVGVATAEQAHRMASATLPVFLRPGGLVTSTKTTGQQWDAPFGWAPLQLVAFEGLRRYGLNAAAADLATRFGGTVLRVFVEHHAIFEKYDVDHRTAKVEGTLRFGYGSNEIGFGWTNAVMRVFEDALGTAGRSAIVAAAAGAR